MAEPYFGDMQDRVVVLAAVAQDGFALYAASVELKADREVVLRRCRSVAAPFTLRRWS